MPESLFNKAAGQRPEACNVIKTRLWHRCFPMHFAQCLRTSFYRKPPNGCFCNEVEKTLQFRRSSLLKVLCKKEVLRNFVNSQEHACTRTRLYQSLFLNKGAVLRHGIDQDIHQYRGSKGLCKH